MEKVDLHIHSTYSDGMDSVSELVEKAKQNNVSTFSITDYDCIEANWNNVKQVDNILETF